MAERSEALSVGVLHGPNLNLLGQREPEIYGGEGLEGINRRLSELAAALDVEISFYQSNIEGEIVDWLQTTGSHFNGLLVNAAAYTHTSIAIRDALHAIPVPFVEVHLSNIYAREPFRHHSHLSDIALAVVCGFRGDSYLLALRGLASHLRAL